MRNSGISSSIRRRSAAGLATFLLAAVAVAGATSASGDPGASISGKKASKIKPVNRSDKGATRLARSIFEGNRKRLLKSKFVTTPPGNNPIAVSNKQLSGFPRRGGSFAIMTNGCPRFAVRPNNSGSTGCRNGGLKIRGARDVTVWRIRIQVPPSKNCLSFRFKFFSEEFPEFVGSIFNDAFIAEQSRFPAWNANSKVDPTIDAPRNFATTANGKLITVNNTGFARVSRGRAKGTTYDAATRKLRASTPIKPGKRLLHLSIFDQGDRQYDSAVFIDRLTMSRKSKCRSGVVPSN